MKVQFVTKNLFKSLLILITFLLFPLVSVSATVSLANAPLASSSNTIVQPNILFILDNSGSMARDYMPDEAGSFSGAYGYKSSQCNGVAYDETITYTPPIKADKTSYSNATFTAAQDDGYNSSYWTTNLNGSHYYVYTGSVTDKNYANTGSTFWTQCDTSESSATTVFTKRIMSTSETATITLSGSNSTSVSSIKVNGVELMSGGTSASSSSSTLASYVAAKITLSGFSASYSGSTVTITGPTTAATYTPVVTKSGTMTFSAQPFAITNATKLQNYANWYTYYRTRLLMMKTSAGIAFSGLGDSYRVGLMRINSSNSPLVELGTFDGSHRSDWYTTFYSQTANNSTPLREALSNAGEYYAGKMSGTTDPIQYSCQQNFTILSTDGYWNGNAGFQLDGSGIGNQDGDESRPMNDGATAIAGYSYTYTRNSYFRQKDSCSGSNRNIYEQPEVGTCFSTSATSGCNPSNWTGSGGASIVTSCTRQGTPSTTNKALSGSPVASSTTGGGSSDSLADVAEYYYKTDLRDSSLGNCGSAGDLCVNNVFKSSKDTNNKQHMTTFTLGLGANGTMKYSSTYEQDSSGDFFSVKLGLTANSSATPPICSWQANGTTCNWPIPSGDSPEAIDDLWHAAVNGRGTYFSATNPTSLADGLTSALVGIDTRKGSAAAAASSTLNPVAGDNMAFIASYVTNEWTGNLEGRGINTDTGQTSANATWCIEDILADSCPTTPVAQFVGDTTIYNCEITATASCSTAGGVVGYSGNQTSGTQYCKIPIASSCTGTFSTSKTSPVVTASSDTRTIKTSMFNTTLGKYELTDFNSAFATANPSYFNASVVAGLSQWSSLDSTQQTKAVGANLVNYLRGQYQYEDRSSNLTSVTVGTVTTVTDNRLFRKRSAIMGDTLESVPTFMGKPVFSYPYPGYSDFKSTQSSRASTVFIGANDGMLHAFASDTGAERWAYVPSTVIPNMWKLADFNYASQHVNFVNGTPLVSDICTANCTDASSAVWKTILVGGLNAGGRGYYALDVTNPASPQLLWEFTTTSGVGSVKDADLGYSYGQPVVTRKADGSWVVLVTSGYNNVSPGNGSGYLYVLNAGTGAIISKISTGVGSTSTPSGLAKITGLNTEKNGNTLGYVYGGDLLGNVWRFDINSSIAATIGTGKAVKFSTLYSDSAGANPQPITTAPMLAKISGDVVVYIGTGKYLEVSDLSNTQLQSLYAIKDDDTGVTFSNPRTSNLMVQQTITNSTDLNNLDTRVVSSPAPVDFYTKRGWFIDFPDTGERVNIDGILDAGVVIVPTTIPTSTACTPGGYSYNNYFDYTSGAAVGGTIASTRYDALIVGLSRFFIDGKLVNQVVTSDGKIQNEKNLNTPTSAGNYTGKRMLWRELLQ
jgi:type IV pilus assembly protein PilY1